MQSTARGALTDLALRAGIRNVGQNCWVGTFLQMLASLGPAVRAVRDVCADGAAILVLIKELLQIRGDAPDSQAHVDDKVCTIRNYMQDTLNIDGQGDPVELTAACMSRQLSSIGLTAEGASCCLAVHIARQTGADRLEAADPLLLRSSVGSCARATSMRPRAAAIYMPTPGAAYGTQGHYTALCRVDGVWLLFNDDQPCERMQPLPAMNLIATNATLILYEREDGVAPPPSPSRLAGGGSAHASACTDHRNKRARLAIVPSATSPEPIEVAISKMPSPQAVCNTPSTNPHPLTPEAAPEATRCELESLRSKVDGLLRGAGGESRAQQLRGWRETFQVTSGRLQVFLRDRTVHDRMFNWRQTLADTPKEFIQQVKTMLVLFQMGEAEPPDSLRQYY